MMETLNSIGITSGMITSAVITILLLAISFVAGRRLKIRPSGFQNFVEWAVGSLYNFFEGILGERGCKRYFPIVATLFIYIFVSNYSGLLPAAGHIEGLAAPTSTINCPLAMATFVFIALQVIGIREHRGLGYYKHLFQPFIFLFPIMLLDDLIRPVSLTLRLYGNIYGEETLTEAFFEMVPIGLPVLMQVLSVLFCLIQALVFALLTSIYIKEALPEGEEHMIEAHYK